MKILVALFCASLAVSSCAHTTPVVTKIGHVVDCTATKVKEQIPAVFTDVLTDLLSSDYAKLLSDVARRVGDDVVACAVLASQQAASARMGATEAAAPNATAIRDHAEEYLRLREVQFSAGPDMGAAAICRPACDACHVCFQLTPQPGGPLLPPTCAPRLPKPAGCP